MKPITYRLRVYRPDPGYVGPFKRDNEQPCVEFESASPFMVPAVGDEINREITFGDYGVRKQTPAIVIKVEHVIASYDDGITQTAEIRTEERTAK